MLAHIRGMARDESDCEQHSRDDLLMCGACAVLNNAPDWVEGLAHIWAAADRLSTDPIDPLNLDQIEAIERSGHANPGR
jgi:hypothetical protein